MQPRKLSGIHGALGLRVKVSSMKMRETLDINAPFATSFKELFVACFDLNGLFFYRTTRISRVFEEPWSYAVIQTCLRVGLW